ncbi:MAG: zinc-dependent metalloprotease [Micromonosporaceae bacterium]
MTDVPFGFGLPGGAPDPNDPQQMAKFVAQLQQMFASPSSGPVNWDLARQLAEQQLTDADPIPSDADRTAVADALRLADHWLEPVTELPSGVHTAVAWTRREWITSTLDVWRKLCDPVAGQMVNAMGDLLPEQMRQQMGPMAAMMQSLGGAMFGGQLGQALASLAREVLAASDIGLPLASPGTAALLPANIREYGTGLELPDDEVRLYVALREAAHQRLFGHVGWLRSHVLNAVETYAKGIKVDREAVEEAMGRIDPERPETMQEINIEGVFTADDTPQQAAALSRLETALALIEGWVTHVVSSAAADRLPHLANLSEAFRRRRAAGGPAEQTFATLVGLELRPRRLRESAALWAAVEAERGATGRDTVWDHPDLLPTPEDFSDPEGFASSQLDLTALDFATGDPGTEAPEASPGEPGTSQDEAGEAPEGGRTEPGTDQPGPDRPERPTANQDDSDAPERKRDEPEQ